MIVGGGEMRGVIDDWFLIVLLAGKRISSGFLFVDIPVVILLDVAHFFVVLLELLSWCEPR